MEERSGVPWLAGWWMQRQQAGLHSLALRRLAVSGCQEPGGAAARPSYLQCPPSACAAGPLEPSLRSWSPGSDELAQQDQPSAAWHSLRQHARALPQLSLSPWASALQPARPVSSLRACPRG